MRFLHFFMCPNRPQYFCFFFSKPACDAVPGCQSLHQGHDMRRSSAARSWQKPGCEQSWPYTACRMCVPAAFARLCSASQLGRVTSSSNDVPQPSAGQATHCGAPTASFRWGEAGGAALLEAEGSTLLLAAWASPLLAAPLAASACPLALSSPR